MKTLHDVPMALVDHGAERSLPPGSGLLIAIGVSILFWGLLVWLVLR
ncbi:MAG: hypothetical protein V4574_17220 [Pseudomonadota bacterium]